MVPGRGLRSDLATERRSLFGMPAATPTWILGVGVVLTLALIGLAQLDAGGQRDIWQFAHWNLSGLAGFIAVVVSARHVTGRERQVRTWVAATLGLWTLYNFVHALISLSGGTAFPSYADAIGLIVFVPAMGVLVASVHGRLTLAEETAVYLDAGILATAVFAIFLVTFGPTALQIGGLRSIFVFAYPLQFFAIALAGSVAVVAVGYSIGPRGAFALLAGAALVGFAYLALVTSRTAGIELFGALSGPLFSIGTLIGAYGGMTWWDEVSESPRHIATTRFLTRSLGPAAAALTLVAVLRESSEFEPLEGFVRIAVLLAGGLVLIRQGLLLRERSLMLAEVQLLHDENDRLVDELRKELAERERVQDQLVNASRMAAVGELAAGVAHEVNNPLTGVLGFAEILLQDFDLEDPRRKDIETIRSEALRARGIVRALRDFARPRPPEPTPTDIGDVITRALDLVRYPLDPIRGYHQRIARGDGPGPGRSAGDPAGDPQRTDERDAGHARWWHPHRRECRPRGSGRRDDHR